MSTFIWQLNPAPQKARTSINGTVIVIHYHNILELNAALHCNVCHTRPEMKSSLCWNQRRQPRRDWVPNMVSGGQKKFSVHFIETLSGTSSTTWRMCTIIQSLRYQKPKEETIRHMELIMKCSSMKAFLSGMRSVARARSILLPQGVVHTGYACHFVDTKKDKTIIITNHHKVLQYWKLQCKRSL